jgi:hypothetical protein
MDNENRYVNESGRYLCKVKAPGNGWIGLSGSGSEFIRIPLLVTDAGSQEGREIVWRGYLTEAAARRTIQTLDDCFGKNWDIKSLASGAASFAGQMARITVDSEEYNGETRHKVKWLNPAEMAPKNEVDATVIEALAERVAKIDRGDDVKAPTKPTPKTSDDIPF